MDKHNILLEKLAKLAVRVGANVQKDQVAIIYAPLNTAPLARMIQKEAYFAGAKKVMIEWRDSEATKNRYLYATDEELTSMEDYEISRLHYLVDNKACRIVIDSPNPHAMEGVDQKRIMMSSRAIRPKTIFFSNFYSASKAQWTIVAYPNEEWAKTVFPTLDKTEAVDKLFEAIMYTSRIDVDTDPIKNWEVHAKRLESHAKLLNEYNFKTLHFKNSLGTDLTVELVDNHIWAGGGEMGGNGVYFMPNIPTEEVFTMPNKDKVNGKVVATKTLDVNGTLVKDFYFVFKDGKVVEYNAKEGYDALKSLIELDEGSSRLGEVALISHKSPISDLNILFNNTLFDENASCHLALGDAYPMNVEGGVDMNEEQLKAVGANSSMTHVDFMFGSSDMEIEGITKDGKMVKIFEKGNFVF